MKSVRLTIRPVDTAVHPVYELITGGADYLSTVDVVNWNVSNEPVGILHRIEGDQEAFATDLDEISEVIDYDITPIDGDTFYIYIRDTSTRMASKLFDIFTHGSLIGVPPGKYQQNGSFTGTVFGPPHELQRAIEEIPDGIEMDIEEIGCEVSQDAITAQLSNRQRAAIVAGIEVGYYEIPRQATHADVASVMGCASSTASEHIKKAESKLVTALFADSLAVQ